MMKMKKSKDVLAVEKWIRSHRDELQRERCEFEKFLRERIYEITSSGTISEDDIFQVMNIHYKDKLF